MDHLKITHHWLTGLKSWVARHRTTSYLIVGLVLIAGAGASAYALLSQKPQPVYTAPVVIKKPAPVKYYSPLTGLEVKDEAATTKPVTAVMIENSPDARPQSGLKQAEVVYEAVTEGGITRFMALYQQNKPKLIGPVRSVRIYDLDWLAPWNASLAHVGGSAAALKEVRTSGKYRDIDQFFNGAYYWRSIDRFAPHNVYTSFAKLDALNKAKGYTTSHPKPLLHEDDKPAATPTATHISIHVSSALYDSSYSYHKATNAYTRSEGGAIHVDREKGAITPTVIVAMYVDSHQVYQDTWRVIMKTSGSGKAVIFQNGTATKVTWHKDGHNGQLSFTDANDQPVALARGQLWITALENGKGTATWHK